jgi:hypothetical protein
MVKRKIVDNNPSKLNAKQYAQFEEDRVAFKKAAIKIIEDLDAAYGTQTNDKHQKTGRIFDNVVFPLIKDKYASKSK